MKRTLTDFSQLSKAMLKRVPSVDEVKPEAPKMRQHDDAEEVLAYFSRSLAHAKPATQGKPLAPTGGTDARLDELRREMAVMRDQVRVAEQSRTDAELKYAEAKQNREKAIEALAKARDEINRLKGECGRLQGEARKAAESSRIAAAKPVESAPERMVSQPPKHLLTQPVAFFEAFPGEVREMVLSALSEARDMARQGSKDRRAAVLDAVLAENKPTGELERRRAELKQILKDAGYYTDPRALSSLGIKLISGHTHWKLDYAGIRMPISKTPSDYRANLNMATDMANRCF